MWQAAHVDAVEALRQGDLLLDVPFVLLTSDVEVDGQGRSSVRVRRKPGVVVTQCCTIENDKIVEIAEVANTAPLRPEQPFFQGLMNTDWPPVTGRNAVTSAFPLEPVPGRLEPKEASRFLTVNFVRSTAFGGGQLGWLQAKRVARMTPEARRRLRLRLALHWSRAEPEDAEVLRALGIGLDFG